jgi:hypothetical protein
MLRATGMLGALIVGAFLIQTVRAGDSSDTKSDALRAKTIWQGVADPDPRWADRKEIGARLRVVERNGEDFVAQIAFLRPHDLHAARLEGKIKNGELVAHITKIIKGDWGPDAVEIVWRGKLDGNNLVLTRTNQKNMTASCKLTLDTNPKKSTDD